MKHISKLLISVFLMSACSQGTDLDNVDFKKQGYASHHESRQVREVFQFEDLIFPEDTLINSRRTVIYNKQVADFWYGNVYAVAPYSIRGVFNFYLENMPKIGWRVLTYTEGANGNIVFEKNGRMIQLTLKDAGGSGTYIEMVVSVLTD